MKLLVVQLSDATHTLLATPLLRCLKKQHPQLELHCLVHAAVAPIVAHNPYIDHLHQLGFSAQTTLHALLPQAFDGVLNLHENKASAELLHRLHRPVLFKQQKGFKAFLKDILPGRPSPHPAEQYLQMASALGVANDGRGLHFFTPKSAEVPYHDIPAAHHAGYLVVDVSSNPFSWPPHLLYNLCQQLQHPLVLIGTADDAAAAQQLCAIDSIKIYNACGKFSLHETADLIRKSKLLVTHQPFTVQLAAAFQKQMVMVKTSAQKMVPPYYAPLYLKQHSEVPYEVMDVAAKKEAKEKGHVWEGEVAALLQSIRRRLQPKA